MSTEDSPSRSRLSRALRHPGLWVAVAFLTMSAPVTWAFLLADDELPHLASVPSFQFTRQDGRPFGLEELKGRPWVANFIFTRCPTVCPTFTRKMAALQESTQHLGPALQLVSFSVDPKYDTPERLSAYAAQHGADPDRWSFLTGDYEVLRETVVRGFKISMGREGTDENDVARIFHGNHFVLVDASGAIRGYFDGTDEAAIARLLESAQGLARASR